nr:MAG TPA: helix-turn-helix domain protein [Caudoviricetes sp.]
MKNEKTAKRLRIALSNMNMKPQELADLSGVSKSSISQYINGSHAPSNLSSGKMGKILNVNPLWLMGFDTSMKQDSEFVGKEFSEIPPEIMTYYNKLNDLGKETATEQVRLLTLDKKYTDTAVQSFPKSVQEPEADYLKVNAAQTRTDKPVTQEDLDHDENLIQEYFANKDKSNL